MIFGFRVLCYRGVRVRMTHPGFMSGVLQDHLTMEKSNQLKMYFLLEKVNFHCHASLLGKWCFFPLVFGQKMSFGAPICQIWIILSTFWWPSLRAAGNSSKLDTSRLICPPENSRFMPHKKVISWNMLSIPHCWWFRNPAPVEVGSSPHSAGFLPLRGSFVGGKAAPPLYLFNLRETGLLLFKWDGSSTVGRKLGLPSSGARHCRSTAAWRSTCARPRPSSCEATGPSLPLWGQRPRWKKCRKPVETLCFSKHFKRTLRVNGFFPVPRIFFIEKRMPSGIKGFKECTILGCQEFIPQHLLTLPESTQSFWASRQNSLEMVAPFSCYHCWMASIIKWSPKRAPKTSWIF